MPAKELLNGFELDVGAFASVRRDRLDRRELVADDADAARVDAAIGGVPIGQRPGLKLRM